MLRLLARDHDVRLLALYADKAEKEALLSLDIAQCDGVFNSRVSAVARSALAPFSGRSLQAAYGAVPALERGLRRVTDEWSPDVVHLNVFRTAHLRRYAPSVPTIIDLDEFRSEYYRQLSSRGSGLRRWIGRYEHARIRAGEQALLTESVAILVSGHHEKATASSANVHVVKTPAWPLPRDPGWRADPDAPQVLFVGRLSYEANIVGLRRFIETVWPRVHREFPSAVLHVVGARPTRSVRALARTDGVELHANVRSVAPHYAAATVAIIPVDRATGVQMKAIEALGAGVPVVTSALTAHLGELEPDKDVLVAESPISWARAVISLLSDEAHRQELARSGLAWFERNHSAHAVARQLEAAYVAAGADYSGSLRARAATLDFAPTGDGAGGGAK